MLAVRRVGNAIIMCCCSLVSVTYLFSCQSLVLRRWTVITCPPDCIRFDIHFSHAVCFVISMMLSCALCPVLCTAWITHFHSTVLQFTFQVQLNIRLTSPDLTLFWLTWPDLILRHLTQDCPSQKWPVMCQVRWWKSTQSAHCVDSYVLTNWLATLHCCYFFQSLSLFTVAH